MTAMGGPVTPATFPLEIITRSRVAVARPAGEIWPHILEPNQWKQGAKLMPHENRFAAVGPDGTPVFLVDEVELVPERRRTIRLTSLDGINWGWSTWYLEPAPGGTVAGYDVYSLMPVPLAALGGTPEAARRQAAGLQRMNQERFDAELLELKRLVEAAGGSR